MGELLDAVASLKGLVLVLLVFGFAPGFCLRLIVLTYPRDDPRRAELIAELYTVPRIWRPLWVAEQLEVGLFEGLRHRRSAIKTRRQVQVQAEDAEAINRDEVADAVNRDEVEVASIEDVLNMTVRYADREPPAQKRDFWH